MDQSAAVLLQTRCAGWHLLEPLTVVSRTLPRVREEANWLFKCISEAHNVLSDSRQRRELDAALTQEERYMFYRNDLTTPPGGVYSFQRPSKAKASASYR